MKKIVLSIALFIGVAANVSAQISITEGNGIFNIEEGNNNNRSGSEMPYLPGEHELTGNQEGNFAPLGGGMLLLVGLGTAYAMSKKKKH